MGCILAIRYFSNLMTKAELVNQMKSNGAIHRPGNTPQWRQAFDLYAIDTQVRLSIKCSKCFDKVKEWLLK